MLRATIDNGYERLGIRKDRVFAEVSDEGSDMAAAVEQGASIQVPCSAHVQQSSMKDIYINEIKEPKLKKDGSEHEVQRMHVQMKSYGQRRMHSFTG